MEQSKQEKVHENSVLTNTQERFNRVAELIEKSQWRKALCRASKIYNIKVYNLEKLTLNRIRELYRTITEKFYKEEKHKETWNENQLRVYVWLLFAYAHAIEKTPQEFSIVDWEGIAGCFFGKSVNLCEFQYNSLKKLSNNAVKWSEEEDKLLSEILADVDRSKNRWNEVAKKFFLLSQKKFFRSSKQCRERWNNYLDPSKSRESWTPEEDMQLIKAVYEKGKKWANISKILDSKRTEHMVKNRFNSLMWKFMKANPYKTSSDNVQLSELEIWLANRPDKEVKKTKKANKKKEEDESEVRFVHDRLKNTVPSGAPANAQTKSTTKVFEQTVQPTQNTIPQLPSIPSPTYPLKTTAILPSLPSPKDDNEKMTHATNIYGKSPILIFSPIMPATYTPLVYSPYGDLGNLIIYQNQNQEELCRQNRFSYESLRHP